MSRTTIGSRWQMLNQRYRGGWHQNPWINAVFSAAHAGGESDGSLATARRNDDNQARQQKAAVRAWENEGGSLDTHQSMCR